MKRKLKLSIAAAAILLVALSLTALAVFSQPPSQQAPASPSPSVSLYELDSDSEFVVKVYNGYVAVYLEAEPGAPVEVTEIKSSTLRLADQELLGGGVTVQGLENLSMFLEDFAP